MFDVLTKKAAKKALLVPDLPPRDGGSVGCKVLCTVDLDGPRNVFEIDSLIPWVSKYRGVLSTGGTVG